MRTRTWLTTAAIICSMTAVHIMAAQNFKTIGIREGLTDNSIKSITQDSNGYMWFATDNGLNRFDGYDIRKYSLKDFGLNFDQFRYVAEDRGQNLWAVSTDNHIYILDKGTDRLSDRPDSVLSSLGIPWSERLRIFIDKTGNLWADTERGLYHYDYSKSAVTSYSFPHSVHDIAADESGAFVSLSDGSIFMIKDEGQMEIRQSGGSLEKLMLDSNGRLWRYGNRSQIMYYDPVKEIWDRLPDNPFTPYNYITCAADDRNGKIWFGSLSNGIITFNYDLTEYDVITHESGNELSIPNNHISTMFVSKNSNLWIGTHRGGTAMIAKERIDIRPISLGIHEEAKTMIEGKDGILWVGLDGKGLCRLDLKDGGFRRFHSENTSIPSDNIVGSTKLSDGTILFATYGGGIFSWNGKDAQAYGPSDNGFREMTRFCSHLEEDSYGNLWVLTFSKGVICLHPDGRFEHFNTDNSELMSDYMTSMTYSSRYNRLFVSNRECIYEIHTGRHVLEKVKEFSQVTALHIDTRNMLWIGTTDGLYHNNLIDTGSFHRIDMSDGLSQNSILDIGEDTQNNLYVTTNDGFTYIYVINDPIRQSIETRCIPYYSSDGTGSGQFTHNSIYCAQDGSVLMGNDGKLIQVSYNPVTPARRSERLTVTSISVSGKQVFPLTDEIRLSHNDNLMVKVSAMDYMNLKKIKYEYNLKGMEEWTLMQENELFLNRIPSGKHELRIRIVPFPLNPQSMINLKIIVPPHSINRMSQSSSTSL